MKIMIVLSILLISLLPFIIMDYFLLFKNVWDYFIPFFVIIGLTVVYTKKQHCIIVAKKIVAEFPDSLNELQVNLLVSAAGVFIGECAIETCRQLSLFISNSMVFLVLEIIYAVVIGNYFLAIVSILLVIGLFLSGLHRYFATGLEDKDKERALKQFTSRYPSNILYSPYDGTEVGKELQKWRRKAYSDAFKRNKEICERAFSDSKYRDFL